MTDVTLTTIADKSAIWKLRMSKLSMHVRDKRATQLVTDANEGRKTGNFNKKLFDGCVPVERTNAAFQACYDLWHGRTVPYLDYEGERMIDSRILMDTMNEFGQLREEAERAVAALVPVWADCIAYDLNRLKHLGNPADYPADPATKYSIFTQLRPVPSVADFRFDIPDADKQAIQAQVAEAEKRAKVYALETMLEPIKTFAKRSAEFQNEKGQRWHDSLVTNIQDVVEAAKRLNITDDPGIAAFIKEIDAYWTPIAFNPSAVKESPTIRDAARDKLNEIMGRMQAYTGVV